MRITPVSYNSAKAQNPNKQNNKQSFGMQFRFADEHAMRAFNKLVPVDELKRLMPQIEKMKAQNGEEIITNISTLLGSDTLRLDAKIDRGISEDIMFEGRGFMPRLKHLTNRINTKVADADAIGYLREISTPKEAATSPLIDGKIFHQH